VTITGLNLQTASSVHFGATAASFTVASATTVKATVPAIAPGTYDVTVTNPDGTSALVSKDRFKVK
jgi:large repetitive protein